jgi:gluconate 5-dehydrogenase
MSAKGRPERELRPLRGQRAKQSRERGGPIRAKDRPERELRPLGGQRAKQSRERGGPIRAKGRPERELRPLGGQRSGEATSVGAVRVVHPFDLSGRLALVTGGGSGLGLAIASGLASAGARVVINGRNQAKLDAAMESLAEAGHAVSMSAFDVTDEAAVARSLAEIESSIGPVDILVNNAAMNRRKSFADFSLDEWRELQATNTDGPFLITRGVVRGMQKRRRGKIVNICSLASDIGRPNIVPYAVSKGALRMMTRALAVELAAHNVQVNGIAPGFFKTEMNAPLIADAEFSAWVAKRTPAGRWGEPAEIAGAAVFLASDAADYVTGHILYVDGGFSASY